MPREARSGSARQTAALDYFVSRSSAEQNLALQDEILLRKTTGSNNFILSSLALKNKLLAKCVKSWYIIDTCDRFMRRYVLPVVVLVLIGVLAFLVVKRVAFKPASAGLKVESTPQATVFLDGKEVGKTPFEDKKLAPGEKTVKLIPEDTKFFSWETKVTLTGGALAYVFRNFAEIEARSSGKIITLEKLADKKKTSLTVISTPDSCQVKIDGEEKGFTPLSLDDLSEGDHRVLLSSAGFEEIQVPAKIVAGFRVNLNFKLAQKEEEEEEKEGEGEGEDEGEEGVTEEEMARPYVEIKDTPTGWLRVRMGPTTVATEAAKVNPGKTFPLLDEESGWYKIEYEKGKEGWISGRYAEKYE